MSKLWPLLTAGVDEAGRGPLAGPVVVSAVILNPQRRVNGLADSKVLTAERRETLSARIRERAIAFSVIVIDVEHIDRLNIFHATMLGMTRAVAELMPQPELALIDGNHAPKAIACDKRAIVDGDALEAAISAASILAKVARDKIMCELDAVYPGYGFARHKGYSTPEHFASLEKLGPCPHHRRSFMPVRRAEQQDLFCDVNAIVSVIA
ncbi:MAG TPA: ribonuclease HII [Rudaea sp.]|jgi:ribonuclease HII|nr:ribonuclease HII [Rudaea sp.]